MVRSFAYGARSTRCYISVAFVVMTSTGTHTVLTSKHTTRGIAGKRNAAPNDVTHSILTCSNIDLVQFLTVTIRTVVL